MALPMLQVALDCESTAEALNVARQVMDQVDVLETGTILCYQDGVKAVSALSSGTR